MKLMRMLFMYYWKKETNWVHFGVERHIQLQHKNDESLWCVSFNGIIHCLVRQYSVYENEMYQLSELVKLLHRNTQNSIPKTRCFAYWNSCAHILSLSDCHTNTVSFSAASDSFLLCSNFPMDQMSTSVGYFQSDS